MLFRSLNPQLFAKTTLNSTTHDTHTTYACRPAARAINKYTHRPQDPHHLLPVPPLLINPRLQQKGEPGAISEATAMARQALTNGVLGCFMHVGLALVLLAYLPVAFLCRLVYKLLVRPFARGEDLRGKVVLITGASSGIGEVLLVNGDCLSELLLFGNFMLADTIICPACSK